MKRSLSWKFFITAFSLMLLSGCNMLPSRNAFLVVEQFLCMGCGECTRVCKADAITIIGNKAVIDPAKCVQCGKCVKVCPYDAIH